MGIGIVEDFLSRDEAAELLEAARTLTTWDPSGGPEWAGRIAYADQLEDPALRDRLVEIRKRVRAKIMDAYMLFQPLYADTLNFNRWPEGTSQGAHADGEHPDGSPHPYAWRRFASLIYLNDDFEGGRIYFPNQDYEPEIRPGLLIFFPSALRYLHGVSRVARGTRYTISSFWTFDARRQDSLPI